MSWVAALALAVALALGFSLLLGAAVLRLARLEAVPARLVPGLMLGVPLLSLTLSAALVIIDVDHPAADPACHHDGHEHVAAHAPLARGGLAAALLPITLPVAALALLRLIAAARSARAALGRAPSAGETTRRRLQKVPLGERNARASWWPHARIAVDAAWWSELAPGERRIVVAHEATHLRRRDPLVAAAACLASAALPHGGWSLAFARWKAWAEQAADSGAARVTGDPLAVAELLVRQHRAHAAAPSPALAFGSDTLQARVHALASGRAPALALRPDLGARELLVLAGLVVWPLLAAEVVHHVAEALLAWPH